MSKKVRCEVIRMDLVETYGLSQKKAAALVKEFHADACTLLTLNHAHEFSKCVNEDQKNQFFSDWIDETADLIMENAELPRSVFREKIMQGTIAV